MMHQPVLVQEVLEAFSGIELRLFFDGTTGAGGHASYLLGAHPEIERYLACDRDPVALSIAKEKLKEWGKRVDWIRGPYSDLALYLEKRKIPCVQGVLLDVGLSSMQLAAGERGFSFQQEGPLDMRMDPNSRLTAEEIINVFSEKELARIFYEYGEETRSRQVAKAIVEARRKHRIRTTGELVELIRPIVRRGKLHPATLVFQGLRIAVNDELGELRKGVDAAMEKVCSGGRIGVISFHSLEDRIVKEAFREGERKGILRRIGKKPLVAQREEVRSNPRARSAKFRVAEVC